MSPFEQLLVVQDHDTRADQLRHRRERLPEREAVAAGEQRLARLQTEADAVEARRAELARDQKRLEDEIAVLADKRGAADRSLYSGTVSNPRELQALQQDIDSLGRRISELEDAELEIMEQLEPVEADAARLTAEQEATAADIETARRTLTAAEAEIDVELDEVRAARDAAAAPVPADLLADYDALRGRLGGVAVARLNGTNCGGCHLALSAVEADRIRHLPPDAAVHCEECGRLLVH